MNKNVKIYGGIALAALLGVIIWALFFKHEHVEGDGHDHDHAEGEKTEAAHEEVNHEETPGVKEVHLNEAQYKATGLVLGDFEKKNLSEVINANGYTKLPPQNQAQVSVQLPGTIQSIKVMQGQAVKAGQILATMQSMAYNNLRLDREKLNQELTASQANLEFLKLEFARQKELSDENVNAKKVFQKVSSDLQAEEAKIKTLQSQIAILGQNIEIGGNSTSPIINIVAPISGNITDINVTIGAAAEVGKPLFSIVDNSKMHVDLLVYEKDLFKVKPGQNVRFILTNQDGSELRGKIFSVGKSFENETKSVAVHADILNERQMLIPGMYVNALVDVGANTVDALPVDAIIKAEGREFVFILEEEAKTAEGTEFHFQRIEVKTGTSQLGFVQTTFLQPVETAKNIVVKGAYYLQSHLTKSEGGGGHSH
ncbi:MAG: efflux RND transporter periplasmic adaptor subunit [Bacteroidia bacterium]|nr:efflux RND transporter periplasmic adaptor subunit [Bacteroidia bacterium]